MQLEDLINYIILILIAVAVYFIITGKFVELTVEKQNTEQIRSAANLLQTISTSSPLLLKDSNSQPIKLLFDKSKTEESLDECCNSLEYDYKFVIEADKTNVMTIYNFENNQKDKAPFMSYSNCYLTRNLFYTTTVDIPANICTDIEHCKFAVASVSIYKTPLSELTYWLSRACVEENDFLKEIPFAAGECGSLPCQIGRDIVFDQSKKKVCINFANRQRVCKKYFCDETINIVVAPARMESPIIPLSEELNCYLLNLKKDGNTLTVWMSSVQWW